jgi:hypothetical protein
MVVTHNPPLPLPVLMRAFKGLLKELLAALITNSRMNGFLAQECNEEKIRHAPMCSELQKCKGNFVLLGTLQETYVL